MTRIPTIRMSQLDNLWCMACRGAYDRQGRFAARPRCWNSLGLKLTVQTALEMMFWYMIMMFFFNPPHFLTLISQGAKNQCLYQTPNTSEGNKKAQGQVMISWPPGRWTWRCAGPLGPQRGELSRDWDGLIFLLGFAAAVRMVTSQNCRAFSELFRFHTQLYLYFILTVWELAIYLSSSNACCSRATGHAHLTPTPSFPPSAALVPKGTECLSKRKALA